MNYIKARLLRTFTPFEKYLSVCFSLILLANLLGHNTPISSFALSIIQTIIIGCLAYKFGLTKVPKELVPKGFDVGKLSDGYHTFDELYEFRKMYNAALFNEWSAQNKYEVHKSICHYEGEQCFGSGWFIVVAILPEGQISNHYKLEDWDLFKVQNYPRALYKYDGHDGDDVLDRLKQL
jgi:hypothetical protein